MKRERVLGMIHSTEILDFSDKDLMEIPKEVFYFKNLKTLLLKNNSIHFIPSDMKILKNLEEFDISNNLLERIDIDLLNCKKLQILDVSGNLIQLLPQQISHLDCLQHIILNNTALFELPAALTQIFSLESIEAKDNCIITLPKSLDNLKNLKVLDLGSNEINHLPKSIGKLENLEELYIENNCLISIPDELENCSKLKIIKISCNQLVNLPTNLKNLLNLEEFNISNNLLCSLPHGFCQLINLKVLHLDYNEIECLPSDFGNLINLQEFYANNNKIMIIPDSFSNLLNLCILKFDNNMIKTLPKLMYKMEKLKILTLSNNKIRNLPSNIGDLINLKVLDLCDNKLLYLPLSIKNLSLTALWISRFQKSSLISFQKQKLDKYFVITNFLLPQEKAKLKWQKTFLENYMIILMEKNKKSSSVKSNNTANSNLLSININTLDTNINKLNETNKEENMDINSGKILASSECDQKIYNNNIQSNNLSKETHNTCEKNNSNASFFNSTPIIKNEINNSLTKNSVLEINSETQLSKHECDLEDEAQEFETNDNDKDYIKPNILKKEINGLSTFFELRYFKNLNIIKDEKTNVLVINRIDENNEIKEGDIALSLNSIESKLLNRDLIDLYVNSSMENALPLFIEIQNSDINYRIDSVNSIHFKIRHIVTDLIKINSLDEFPFEINGSISDPIHVFNNKLSPFFVTNINYDFTDLSDKLYNGDRLIEINGAPIPNNVNDAYEMIDYLKKSWSDIISLTVRHDPPTCCFHKIKIEKTLLDQVELVNVGHMYNSHPSIKIKNLPEITNNKLFPKEMWLVEVEDICLLGFDCEFVVNLFKGSENALGLTLYDDTKRHLDTNLTKEID